MWIYKGETFNPESVEALYGFIYEITYEIDDKEYYYIGKKLFNSRVKKFYTKKQMVSRTDKRLKNYYYVVKESSWREYIGSCKDERIQDMIIVEKEILRIIPMEENMSVNLTYFEVKEQFAKDVLIDNSYLNANISGTFFRGRIGSY
jgi:hypothetical protein